MALQYILPPDGNFSTSKDAPAITLESTLQTDISRRKGLCIIVAAGIEGEIGLKGDMIWHLPGDLKRFKALTMGATLIMGRKTWESLPRRPLPGRRNIVVSRNPEYDAPGAEIFRSLEEAIDASAGDEKVFIIGGGEIYRKSFPYATEVELTRVMERCPEADTFFPDLADDEWVMLKASEEEKSPSGVGYRFETYRRRER